jgi:phosphoglucosamine mutase
MSRTYFGTDGIRGTVGNAPITPDFMLRLGHAVGQVLGQGAHRPTVLIGKDTRISGYMIESALEAGFASAGVDVVLTGPLPTPGVAYLTRALRLDLGVVISASHNPFDDNGIKFFSARGEKLPDDWELEVERAIASEQRWVGSAELGRARRLDDAGGRYIEFCKSTYSNDLTLRGLSIVVDAAHGAAYHVAPQVFHELGAEVTSIGCRPDGFNINAGFGATAPQALVETVRSSGATYGIALDGDGDRVQIVDAGGRLYNGDELLYVLAVDRLAHGSPVPGVVGTLMTNLGVELALRERGIEVVRTAVGDRYVLEELVKRRWLLGGEGSGHLLALDKHTTGDGIVSALMVLQAAVRSGRSLAELLEGVSLHTQTLINVRLKAGEDWRANRVLADRRAEIDRQLGASGRVLIRPSGTEPVVRVMVEAKDPALSRDCAERLAAALA